MAFQALAQRALSKHPGKVTKRKTFWKELLKPLSNAWKYGTMDQERYTFNFAARHDYVLSALLKAYSFDTGITTSAAGYIYTDFLHKKPDLCRVTIHFVHECLSWDAKNLLFLGLHSDQESRLPEVFRLIYSLLAFMGISMPLMKWEVTFKRVDVIKTGTEDPWNVFEETFQCLHSVLQMVLRKFLSMSSVGVTKAILDFLVELLP